MSAIPHIGFIVAAYAVTTVVMLAMVVTVVLDGRALRRLLAKLETRAERPQGRTTIEETAP